jgi:Fe-S cluster assembly protein SufD
MTAGESRHDPRQEELQRVLDRSPAVRALRQRALQDFDSRGYPTTRLEDWKYTNLREIAEGGFAPGSASTPEIDGPTTARLREELGGGGLVFVNGAAVPELSGGLPNARLQSLRDALEHDPTAVEKLIAAVAGIERSSLVALNAAQLGAGALVDVPDETTVEEPIVLLYAAAPGGEARADHVRNLVRLGRNSRATVVEHYVGIGAAGTGRSWTNSATDIALGEGARLSHYVIQRQSPDAYHTADVAARQGRDSFWHSLSISLGARLCRNDIRSLLAEPGAGCSMDGLYMANGNRHVDHHTTIDHTAPHCTSHELYKGILGGRATGVFNGKVIVRNEGQKTDSAQLNKNLLLSDGATINTKPQLEIFADDVKCSHGATTGRLDEEALFFLRARGIDAAAARSLLTYAFANEIVERIAIESLRARLEGAVREMLDDLTAGEGRGGKGGRA